MLINEIFHSLKGEGVYTGTPMIFIRLSGCNLSCEFCDTKDQLLGDLSVREIMDQVEEYSGLCNHVVITGGEPTMQDLHLLIDELHSEGYLVHIETNGTLKVPGTIDWIAVSPKTLNLNRWTIENCDEIKFLVGNGYGIDFMDEVLEHYTVKPSCTVFLMPIAKSHREGDKSAGDLIADNVEFAKMLCLENGISLCMQMHKILNIP